MCNLISWGMKISPRPCLAEEQWSSHIMQWAIHHFRSISVWLLFDPPSLPPLSLLGHTSEGSGLGDGNLQQNRIMVGPSRKVKWHTGLIWGIDSSHICWPGEMAASGTYNDPHLSTRVCIAVFFFFSLLRKSWVCVPVKYIIFQFIFLCLIIFHCIDITLQAPI